jgi:hypothetical protein
VSNQDWRVDSVLLLLAVVMLFLVSVLILSAFLLPNNTPLFIVISGLLANTSGSFFTRMSPKHPNATTTEKEKQNNGSIG